MSPNTQTTLTSLGLLLLRVGFGGYMMTHGWGKFRMLLNGEFDKFPDPLGIGHTASLFGAAGAEFVCAILVVIGLLTRFAAVPLVFTMGVAAFVVHRADPWMMGGGAAKEPAIMYLVAFLTLVFTGPGRYALDTWVLGPRRKVVRSNQD